MKAPCVQGSPSRWDTDRSLPTTEGTKCLALTHFHRTVLFVPLTGRKEEEKEEDDDGGGDDDDDHDHDDDNVNNDDEKEDEEE